MISYINNTSFNISEEIIDFLSLIKNEVCENEVELVIVDNNEIRALNRNFLNKDCETDVLSFSINNDGINIKDLSIGSIVISITKALDVINIYKHSIKDELAILFIHGLLHLLGYDHELDNGEHRKKEKEILNKFGIDTSLIERSLEE